MNELQTKQEALKTYLLSLESVAVAFSSGVDSTFLLKAAIDALGTDHVVAVTAKSCSFPERELKEATAFCKENGIRHIVCESEELDIEGFRHNPKNRCYLCKHDLFEKIWSIAKENDFRIQIYSYFKELGFSYITLDLLGYRTGSMNETLEEEERI